MTVDKIVTYILDNLTAIGRVVMTTLIIVMACFLTFVVYTEIKDRYSYTVESINADTYNTYGEAFDEINDLMGC